jgi:hypothetical protein
VTEQCAYILPVPTDADSDSPRQNATSYSPPPETQRLIDELYREELRDARRMSPAEKIRAGQSLFESACRITLAGIRNQFPEASDEECREILRQRLKLQRKLEETS